MSCLSLVARRGVEPLAQCSRAGVVPLAILTDRQQPENKKYDSIKY